MKASVDKMVDSNDGPVDTGYIVYISFFVLGVGVLFPWNAFITAATYFGSRFCGTDHEKSFEDDVGSAYMAANLAVLILVVRYQNLFTRKFRVLGSFVCWFVLFVGVTVMVLFKDIPISFLYYFTLLACVLCGVFSAICSGGIFGMVAQFPPIYVQAVMSGQGLSGLTAALVSLAAAFSSNDDDTCDDDDKNDDGGGDDDDDGDCSKYKHVDYGSFAYFVVACAIFLFCIVGFIILERAPFARYYDQEDIKPMKHKSISQHQQIINDIHNNNDNENNNNMDENGSSTNYARLTDGENNMESTLEGGQGQDDAEYEEIEVHQHHMPTMDEYYRVLHIIKSDVFSVWFVFTVTISLFPGISAEIRPLLLKSCSNQGVFSVATFTACLFVAFNLLDLCGRSSAGFIQLISKSFLPYAATCRLIFIPLFLLCNISGSRFHILFEHSFWPLLFMSLMAFSNGYISTLAMIYGPSRVEHHDSEIAGSIMILALTAGLFSGAMLAYLMNFIVLG
jgi:equilibrative nucleoside transporter 1/2/3